MNTTEELPHVEIAVALFKKNYDILLTWNDNWGGFILPMTKLKTDPVPESVEQTAVRALAELLFLPVRVIPGTECKITSKLQVSNRTLELKEYHFGIVQVELHPDFEYHAINHRNIFIASPSKLLAGEYQPLSLTTRLILETCDDWGLL